MEEKRFTLRMDGGLFEQVSKKASENHRSVAKEIEYAVSLYLGKISTLYEARSTAEANRYLKAGWVIYARNEYRDDDDYGMRSSYVLAWQGSGEPVHPQDPEAAREIWR